MNKLSTLFFVVILLLFVVGCVAFKRPTYSHGGPVGKFTSASLFVRGSSQRSQGLPFTPKEVVEHYLDQIPGYRIKKEATKPKSVPQESVLKNHLIFNEIYDRTSRPVLDDRTSVNVKAGISLYHVLDLDEKMQILSCVIAIRLSWFDQYLQWETAKYANISAILLPSNLIWLPDIVTENNAELFPQKRHETNVIVSNDGFVLWMFPSIIKTICYLDLSWFPFDEQSCDILMSSLSYDIRQMNFTTSVSNNASYYDESGQEWTVVSILAQRREVVKPQSGYKTARIIFRLVLRRKPLFYMYTCVFPCFLIYFVCLFSFFVPAVKDQAGKIELPLTSLLSIVVLQMTVADSLAATDTVPLISKIYAWTMVQCCTSLIFSVTTTIYSRRKDDRKIPAYLQQLAFPSAAMLCNTRTKRTVSAVSEQQEKSDSSPLFNKQHQTTTFLDNNKNSKNYGGAETTVNDDSTATLLHYNCNGRNTTVWLRIGDFFWLSTQDPRVVSSQWELVARRLNAVFLILFLILTVLGYALCLPSLSKGIF